ncbi:MAG: methanogenesis marker 6 protein [Candidatus Methanomethylophilaceae archaeon]|jgi:putative methanogenesis marker protein 6
MSEERETRLLMISPTSMITPNQLARTIQSMGREVTIKETCYGCLVEGPRKEVREIRDEIRKLDNNGIFSKIRAYPCGDPRRCRAHHGTRPGFAQLESEWKTLTMINAGLNAIDKGESAKELPEKKQLSIEKFKKICEVN